MGWRSILRMPRTVTSTSTTQPHARAGPSFRASRSAPTTPTGRTSAPSSFSWRWSSPTATTTGATSCSGPTACSTSALATVARPATRRATGRTHPPSWAASCASTLAGSTPWGHTRSRMTTPSPEAAARPAERYGPTASETPGGSASTWRQGRSGRPMWGRTSTRKLTSSGRASTMAGTSWRGHTASGRLAATQKASRCRSRSTAGTADAP